MTTSLADAVGAFAPTLPLAVAYSGGADSTALLLACAEKWPGQVQAFHVHHGLQAAADDFVAHCVAFCQRIQVPLAIRRVQAGHRPGQSPEAAARLARYEAFAVLAHENRAQSAIKSIATGQHADDQVETLLLALSRGAGLPGLSAMAPSWVRDGITYYRPLLAVAATDIRAWLAARAVAGIEDPSNADQRYTRNHIRHALLPALHQVFPQFRDTFARSSRHAAQAQALLAEVATQDLADVGNPPVIGRLQALSQARQTNLLRHWLRLAHQTTATAAQMSELLDQIAACVTRGHHIQIKVGTGFVKRQGVQLHWYNP